MTYMDGPPLPRWRTRIERRPLDNPPTVDDATRVRILDEAERYPNFTAAELAAALSHDGVAVDTLTVRGVLEASS
ncbi:hypothetical protein [Paractinoplanes toevensis]|uniref:Uncharacterized protein n=1 Tax=Paractinoplanes toevensis TaxID=571911 RepID=A0A919T412_9ACTN|nr:hypothetical protein [Actinoplanes toevensis]GIM88823.1 hypothetical protein Ato02nite_006160 [Actinoplanes toevensis]